MYSGTKILFITLLFISIFIFPSILLANVTKTKTVYFTFDADMTPYMKKESENGKVSSWYSKNLINYLENEKIPSTIFITGMFAEMYPDLIKEMSKYPTIKIANHTYDHSGFDNPCYKLKILKTDDEKIQEIEKTQKILTNLIGYTPKYFRYPGLCRNKHDDVLVNKLGLSISNKGLISGDAFNKNSKYTVKKIMNEVHDGSVIIMHLGGPNSSTTDVSIKEIVDKLKKENYVFKILD